MKKNRKRPDRPKKKVQAIARHIRQGALTLGDVLGLSNEEMQAVAQVGEGLRRRGNIQEALTIYGMLATVDPMNGKWWSAMAALHLSGGAHGLAVICFETLALLQGRNPAHTQREIHALQQLGAQQLALQLSQLLIPEAGTKEPRS